jgi:hypothetical protein
MFRLLVFSAWFFFHPVHVTLTSIDWIPETSSFNVFVRMYFDDFILDCKMNREELKDITFTGNDSLLKSIMEEYIGDKIKLSVNQKLLGVKFKNIKLVDNEVSMDLEYGTVKKPKTIVVQNYIMTDLHSDQSNMLIVRVNDFEEGVKLTPGLTEHSFKIK